MMKCRGMGAAMRKMGGGSMKPVAMKEGKMVERKAYGKMVDRKAYGKMVKRKMKGKSC
jgi:hypothetical protein